MSGSAERKPRCYLAGPMRGIKHWNFPAFDEAKKKWEALGYEVLSPADMDREAEGYELYPPENLTTFEPTHALKARAMLRDLEAIATLEPGTQDKLVLLRGWQASTGARAEGSLASFFGVSVVEDEKYDASRFLQTG